MKKVYKNILHSDLLRSTIISSVAARPRHSDLKQQANGCGSGHSLRLRKPPDKRVLISLTKIKAATVAANTNGDHYVSQYYVF